MIRQDNRALLVGNVKSPVVHTLVSYIVQPDEETATPIDIYQVPHSQISIRACSFHPHLPLAIFSLRRFDSNNQIILWYFGAQPEIELSSKSRSVELLAGLVEGTVKDGDLQFSACGTQVIVWTSSPRGRRNAPVVIALEQYALYVDIARILLPPKVTSDPVSSVLTQTHETDSMQVADAGIKGGQLIMAEDSASKLSISVNGAARSIDIVRNSFGTTAKESQPLLSLPESWNRSVVESGVTMRSVPSGSSAREENIKIVLNLVPQPYYTYSDPGVEHLPAVVFKDTRALLPPSYRNSKMSLETPKRRLACVKAGSTSAEDACDERSEKRLRRTDSKDPSVDGLHF
jgi:hypothetical protein